MFNIFFILISFLIGHNAFSETSDVSVEFIVPVTHIQPGSSFHVGIKLNVPYAAHTYSDPSGDSGFPTNIVWDLPPEIQVGGIEWPHPDIFKEDDLITYGYRGTVILPIRLTASQTLNTSQEINLKGKVSFLVCQEACIPYAFEFSTVLPVKADPLVFNQSDNFSPQDDTSNISILSLCGIVISAFIGGLILNLMPCVFPVIGLKILHFVSSAHEANSVIRRQGLLFTSGVLISFWILAGLLLLLRHQGEVIGWGFQLQNPLFVLCLITLLFVLALIFLGVFEIGLSLTSIGGVISQQSHGLEAFFSGVLATVVATPCTAPFMGAALGVALTQSYAVSFFIFTSLGLGMSTPYLLLSFFPQGLKYLPKPGVWMETLKQFLAFPLIATAIWLLWVFHLQKPQVSLIALLWGFLAIAFGAWIYGKFGSLHQALLKRTFSLVFFLTILASVGYYTIHALDNPQSPSASSHEPPPGWEKFSIERLESLKQSGQSVFVDVTAAWCLTCQANFQRTLKNQTVLKAFKDHNITLLWADWTNKDPTITDYLSQLGRSGVPVYALYLPHQKEPVLLPEVLSPEDILNIL